MITKIDIISGFLGAGKTTLINKILGYLAPLEKIALIENEFGEIGVDGQLFTTPGIEVREINSGCICCTLFGDFVAAMRALISQVTPERIIIEPTGVGKLSDVIKACRIVGNVEVIGLNMLITVVDCLKYKMYSYMFGDFFTDQILSAKTIILSRTQLADRVDVEKIVADICKLNSEAKTIAVPWDQLSGAEIIQVGQENNREHVANFIDSIDLDYKDNNIQVWSKYIVTKYHREQFHAILIQLQNEDTYGMIIRGKGYFQTIEGNWLQFDYVPGEINYAKIDNLGRGRIVIIGRNINKSALDNLLKL